MVENLDKTLNGFVIFIRGLSLKLDDEGWLLEDGCIEYISLSTGKGSREDSVEALTIKVSQLGGGGVE